MPGAKLMDSKEVSNQLKYERQRRYLTTEKGKLANRKAQKAYRDRQAMKIIENLVLNNQEQPF